MERLRTHGCTLILLVMALFGCTSSPTTTPSSGTATPALSPAASESSALGSRYIRYDPAATRVIVFIHGFTGDSTATWTNAKTGAYWPDLLTQDPVFDGYNIYVYEYDTVRFSQYQSIDEIAEDVRLFFEADSVTDHEEIVLLTHSLGGVVTRAYLNKYRDTAAKVNFIYFFATPTTGSHIANIGKVFTNNAQLKQLAKMTSASFLANQQRQWLAAEHDIDSYCAYELQPIFGTLVVPMDAATALCTKRLDTLNVNHIEIVKPADKRDRIYLAFKGAFLEQAADGAATASTAAPGAASTSTVATATPAVASSALAIQQESFVENVYLIPIQAGAVYTVGTQLVVYGEISPDVPVAIGLLRVTRVNPTTLSAQAILVHPDREIRPNLLVDTNLQYLSESELVPATDIAVGYLLGADRVYLRPKSAIAAGDLLEALKPEISGSEILDYLPFVPPVTVRVVAIGSNGRVARVELVQGDWPIAGTILRRLEAESVVISATATEGPPAASLVNADAIYKVASVYMKSESYAQAVPLFQQVLALQPDNVNALYNLGVCYMKTERYEQAIVAFEDFIRQSPAHVKVEEAHYNLGVIFRAIDEFELAKEQFSQISVDSELYAKAQNHLEQLSSRE